jgi:peptidyl-prolyl cis-trans isomerase C
MNAHSTFTKLIQSLACVVSCGVATLALAQTPSPAATAAVNEALADNKPIRVNGIDITRSDIEAGYARITQRGLPDNLMTRLLVRNELIAKELFRQNAVAQGLENAPEIAKAIEQARANALVQVYVARNLVLTPITEAQVRVEYDRTRANVGPREYKAKLIQFADAVEAQTVLQRIVTGQQSFEDAAAKHSRHITASRGGEMDWVSFTQPALEGKTNGVSLGVAQALSTLTAGSVSAVLNEGGALIAVKLDQVRDTVIPSFENSAASLRQMLEHKERERATVKLVTELIAKSKIEQ